MRTILGIFTVMMLAGCATDVPTVQPVNIVATDFCRIVDGKLTWDIADTRDTITGVRRFNAKWDARCGKGKQTS